MLKTADLLKKLNFEVQQAQKTSDHGQIKKKMIRSQLLCELILEEIEGKENDKHHEENSLQDVSTMNHEIKKTNQNYISDSIFDF